MAAARRAAAAGPAPRWAADPGRRGRGQAGRALRGGPASCARLSATVVWLRGTGGQWPTLHRCARSAGTSSTTRVPDRWRASSCRSSSPTRPRPTSCAEIAALVVSELVAHVRAHGRPDGDGTIELTCEVDDDELIVRVRDAGSHGSVGRAAGALGTAAVGRDRRPRRRPGPWPASVTRRPADSPATSRPTPSGGPSTGTTCRSTCRPTGPGDRAHAEVPRTPSAVAVPMAPLPYVGRPICFADLCSGVDPPRGAVRLVSRAPPMEPGLGPGRGYCRRRDRGGRHDADGGHRRCGTASTESGIGGREGVRPSLPTSRSSSRCSPRVSVRPRPGPMRVRGRAMSRPPRPRLRVDAGPCRTSRRSTRRSTPAPENAPEFCPDRDLVELVTGWFADPYFSTTRAEVTQETVVDPRVSGPWSPEQW